MAQVVVDFHEPQGGEAVEPGVGDGLQGLAEAVARHALNQLVALPFHLGRPGLAGDEGHVALADSRRDFQLAAGLSEPQQMGTGGDGGDEVAAGLGGHRS